VVDKCGFCERTRGGEFTSTTFKEHYGNVCLHRHLTTPYST
jgi:hypothetical protein